MKQINVKTVKSETKEMLNRLGFAVEYTENGFTVECKTDIITATCIDYIRRNEQVGFVSVSLWHDNKVKALFFWEKVI